MQKTLARAIMKEEEMIQKGKKYYLHMTRLPAQKNPKSSEKKKEKKKDSRTKN